MLRVENNDQIDRFPVQFRRDAAGDRVIIFISDCVEPVVRDDLAVYGEPCPVSRRQQCSCIIKL